MTILEIIALLPEPSCTRLIERMSPETHEMLELQFLRIQHFMPGAFPSQIALTGQALISAWLAGMEDKQAFDLKVMSEVISG